VTLPAFPFAPRWRGRALVGPALALALGGVHATAFAPWDRWWLQVLALSGLFALVRLQTRAAASSAAPPTVSAATGASGHARAGTQAGVALKLGFAFGIGWFGVGVSWVYVSMHVYGLMAAPLAGAATAGFCALLAIFPAAALWAVHRALPESTARATLAVPAAWMLGEWARGHVLTGFPWLATGYAHTDGPLAGLAPLAGVYGVSLAAALLAACTAALVGRQVRGRAALACFAAVLVLLLGGERLRAQRWTQPQGPVIAVSLAQGNSPQDLKFAAGGFEQSLATYLRLAASGPPVDLIVLPESVLPVPLSLLPEEVPRAFRAAARARGAALVFGIFIEDPPGEYLNSAVAFTADAAPMQRYAKRHLVPFGEFIPWGFRWFVDLMNMPIGDQRRGTPLQKPFAIAGQRIAVNICYEDLFGAEIADAWHDPSTAPTVLLNLSNLAWFDDSLALPQHLQISRMRVLETGLPMLRATNSGATAVIGADGQVEAKLAHRTEAALVARVQGMAGTTPYVRWRDTPALLAAAALLALAFATFVVPRLRARGG
jgi:apolipoprotein N-acyltransferase